MCGINGLIGFSDTEQTICRMNELISHRGPDAVGEWTDKYIGLGHRRLSIIDLSPEANQPFVKDNLIIVYNGEIYNFRELREELVKKGVKFRTKSDTEVVLELFRKYRKSSFDKLLGMFAFCIYDMDMKEFFLVRDYFGIKPLYYVIFGKKRLAFSSELKALLTVSGIQKEINPKALVSCLNYLWVCGNDAIFKDIRKLPPAHYLYGRIDDKGLDIRIERYWELKPDDLTLQENELKNKMKELVEKSIKRHLVSDVPVGAFLSGGLDSSLIIALAKRFNGSLSTYTVSIGRRENLIEKMPDDNHYAKKVASMFGLNHKDIYVSPRAANILKEIVYILDEPIGDPAAINTYLISKAAKESGIKILLSGMGADELFAGYRRHYATLLASRFNSLPDFFKASAKMLTGAMPVRVGRYGIRQIRWLKRFFSFTDMEIDLAYMRSYSYYDKAELCELFNHNLNEYIDEIYKEHSDIFYRIREIDIINKMCYTDINMFMTGLNLAYTDRASMAASVEVRVPYIDKEIVEFVMSIEGGFKIRRGISKYILKKAACDYLPRYIVYRPKASFTMPIRAWISQDLKEMVDELLSESRIKKRGIFNYKLVKRIIEEDSKGIKDNAYRIYQLLTTELWFDRFLDG